MRWIDRGPEPRGIAGYASRFTQGWIDYFDSRVGWRPEDYYWREFRSTLGSRSNNICWYCERHCYVDAHTGDRASTVDHFRPISKFPALSYIWTNWIFSCQRCNVENKGDGWPELGYVDPCAATISERPDQYFDYDSATGEIIPKIGLTGDARRKAWHTIEDLGLNKLDLRYYRFDHTRKFISDLSSLPVEDRQDFIALFTEQPVEYAGVTRMVVERAPELF